MVEVLGAARLVRTARRVEGEGDRQEGSSSCGGHVLPFLEKQHRPQRPIYHRLRKFYTILIPILRPV